MFPKYPDQITQNIPTPPVIDIAIDDVARRLEQLIDQMEALCPEANISATENAAKASTAWQ